MVTYFHGIILFIFAFKLSVAIKTACLSPQIKLKTAKKLSQSNRSPNSRLCCYTLSVQYSAVNITYIMNHTSVFYWLFWNSLCWWQVWKPRFVTNIVNHNLWSNYRHLQTRTIIRSPTTLKYEFYNRSKISTFQESPSYSALKW